MVSIFFLEEYFLRPYNREEKQCITLIKSWVISSSGDSVSLLMTINSHLCFLQKISQKSKPKRTQRSLWAMINLPTVPASIPSIISKNLGRFQFKPPPTSEMMSVLAMPALVTNSPIDSRWRCKSGRWASVLTRAYAITLRLSISLP